MSRERRLGPRDMLPLRNTTENDRDHTYRLRVPPEGNQHATSNTVLHVVGIISKHILFIDRQDNLVGELK